MIRVQRMYRRMTQWRRLHYWQARWRDEDMSEADRGGPAHLKFGPAARADLWDIDSQLPVDPDDDDS